MNDQKLKEWDKYSSDSEEKVEEEINKKTNNKRKKKKQPIEEEKEKEEYSEQDKYLINKFLPMAKNSLDESELFALIKSKKSNQKEIENEIKKKLKLIEEKGEEYGWTEVK